MPYPYKKDKSNYGKTLRNYVAKGEMPKYNKKGDLIVPEKKASELARYLFNKVGDVGSQSMEKLSNMIATFYSGRPVVSKKSQQRQKMKNMLKYK